MPNFPKTSQPLSVRTYMPIHMPHGANSKPFITGECIRYARTCTKATLFHHMVTHFTQRLTNVGATLLLLQHSVHTLPPKHKKTLSLVRSMSLVQQTVRPVRIWPAVSFSLSEDGKGNLSTTVVGESMGDPILDEYKDVFNGLGLLHTHKPGRSPSCTYTPHVDCRSHYRRQLCLRMRQQGVATYAINFQNCTKLTHISFYAWPDHLRSAWD